MYENIVKAAVNGGIFTGGSMVMFGKGKKVRVELPGINDAYPLEAVSFLTGVSISVLSDIAHSWLIPYVSPNKKWESRESMVLQLAMGAGGSLLLARAINPGLLDQIGVPKLLAAGASAEVVSNYATSFIEGQAVSY